MATMAIQHRPSLHRRSRRRRMARGRNARRAIRRTVRLRGPARPASTAARRAHRGGRCARTSRSSRRPPTPKRPDSARASAASRARNALEPPSAAAVERARAYLDAHADRAVPLAELAAHAGLSASHLQRSFKRLVGVSPKEYQDAQSSEPLQVAPARRRHREPRDIRGGLRIEQPGVRARRSTARNDAGIVPAWRRRRAHRLHDRRRADRPRPRRDDRSRRVRGGARRRPTPRSSAHFAPIFRTRRIERDDDAHATWVRAVLDRVRRSRARGVDTAFRSTSTGTAFQWQVWKALQEIPAGERRSYQRGRGSDRPPEAPPRRCSSLRDQSRRGGHSVPSRRARRRRARPATNGASTASADCSTRKPAERRQSCKSTRSSCRPSAASRPMLVARVQRISVRQLISARKTGC